MARRLVIGPLLIALVVLMVWADQWLSTVAIPESSPWSVFALKNGFAAPGLVLLPVGCLVCARAAIELSRMYKAAGLAASRRVVVFAAIAGVITGGLSIGSPERSLGGEGGYMGAPALATAAALVVAFALLMHVRHKEIKGACGAAGSALMAFVYSGVVLGFIMAIRVEYSAWVVLGVILTAKSCDTGAYFTGVAIGKHKLIPWISPGKTWEGLIGGMCTSGAVGALLTLLAERWSDLQAFTHFSWWHGFVAGALLGLAAQVGDLSASVLKRDAGLKDSGRLLPGMGGIIDVIDSLVLAGPAAFWYLKVVAG